MEELNTENLIEQFSSLSKEEVEDPLKALYQQLKKTRARILKHHVWLLFYGAYSEYLALGEEELHIYHNIHNELGRIIEIAWLIKLLELNESNSLEDAYRKTNKRIEEKHAYDRFASIPNMFVDEIRHPYKVVNMFFNWFDLKEVRQILGGWLSYSLSPNQLEFDDQSRILWFMKELNRLIDGLYLIIKRDIDDVKKYIKSHA